MKPSYCSAALIYDLFDARPWRQRIVDRAKRDSVTHAIGCGKQRFVFRQLLPVAAMHENKQGRISQSRRKKIQGFVGMVAPAQILLASERLSSLAAPNCVLRHKRL